MAGAAGRVARDIFDLFSIGKRYSFLRFLELLWARSGRLCELTSFTAVCEASRQTLANDLDIFAATGVVHVLRPFATLHPKAALWLVAEDRQSWMTRRHGAIEVVECGPAHLPKLMARHRRRAGRQEGVPRNGVHG